MKKYIDAEKLKKSIDNYVEGARAALNPTDGDADYYKGKIDACKDMQELVTSLQQEQPEGLHFTPLNRLIQKIPSENWNDTVNNYAKKLRDCLIKEGYLKDAEVLQGYISYMNGNNVPMATMDKQEQKEVDLEKEAVSFCFDNGINISPRQAKNIARHFWNRGFNERKE